MTVIGGIGFLAPWLLVALAALPILWLILRAIPPAPIRRRFPGVALLLGLTDDDTITDRTPWWLLLLRMLAVGAVILGLAGPVLNPRGDTTGGTGPVLVLLDGSWAGAPSWPGLLDAVDAELANAGSDGRSVAVLNLADPEPVLFQPANIWRTRVSGMAPSAWLPGETQIAQAVQLIEASEAQEVVWFSDGIDYVGKDDVLAAADAKGGLRILQGGRNPVVLQPAVYQDGVIALNALRALPGDARDVTILAQGKDPAGNARLLASAVATFEEGELGAQVELSLPSELRSRISRFEIGGVRSAGATTLTDDSLRRREVALIAGRDSREGLELLSPLHYLQRALDPTADVLLGPLSESLLANPDVIVLADVATLSAQESEAVTAWVDEGGLLVRFAGPRVAASDVSRAEEDPLMPVRLRSGGRSVGGAMSWGSPKELAPFVEGSPFFGLDVPPDIQVNAQVMAQPDPTLANRVIASLTDGTPLVTRKELGQGQVVLFHVTANAEWSSLPLSGLFVEMLERLAVFSASGTLSAEELEGTLWQARSVLNGFGQLQDAGTLPGVDGMELVAQSPGPQIPPGLYQSDDRSLAKNVITADTN
ncbi:MAG: BatA domain-containing protein, partial [Rhodobacteraceae bacterium]|nr:BatA domain-containing protein [Paracoccaceae bacterium]